jgi:hypothetical protein
MLVCRGIGVHMLAPGAAKTCAPAPDPQATDLQLCARLLSIGACVQAGVFGMNIPISIFHEDHAWLFKWVLLGSGAGGMAVFAGLISWIKYNNLIN